MIPFKITNNECTGCLACMNVCEKEAIHADYETEGFYRPIVDFDKCVNCGMCQNICPQNKETNISNLNSYIYAGFVKDNEKRVKSSSGGLFYCIAENFLKNENTIVASVCFNDSLQTVFKIATKISELDAFRKSKYVQAYPGMIYRDINDYLQRGYKILFAGLPCHVTAVKSLCEKNESNLFCIDYICHGVPSPKIWSLYCSQMELNEKDKLENVDFRYNKDKWDWNNFAIKFYFSSKNNKEFKADDCNYYRAFIDNYIIQNSCFSCKYKHPNSRADLTLGDFWEIEKNFPIFCEKHNVKNGISVVCINNKKGKELLELVKDRIIIEQTNLNSVTIGNPCISKCVSKPENKDYYFQKMLKSKNIIKSINDVYTEIQFKNKMKKRYNKLYNNIKKILNFFKG